MCGMSFFLINKRKLRHGAKGCVMETLELLDNRGPDHQMSKEYDLGDYWLVSTYSTVLHMRGQLSPQPIEHIPSGHVLMWNAEIFGGIQVSEGANDGQVILNLLVSCQTDAEVLDVFKQIQGPYAFIFFQKNQNAVWFGRDVFGRRSLTFYQDPDTQSLIISTVVLSHSSLAADVSNWKELSAAGIYKMLLSDNGTYSIQCWPWSNNSMHPNIELNASINPPISLNGVEPLNMLVPEDGDVCGLVDCDQPLVTALDYLAEEAEAMLEKLSQAVYRRVKDDTYSCPSCSEQSTCTRAHISIMFSGGIDSMFLAHLAHQFVPKNEPIDLLNVAFQMGTSLNFDVPDRITGRQALAELSPDRTWNFVEINVTREELQKCRAERISSLIRPLDSVLDDSIGCAMWFASRGVGLVDDRQGGLTPYTSTARVVLSGLGADEQLGGYSRHRSSFNDGGYEKLLEELNMDIMRISARNLGRDDRIIGDHGKEARFPFLDEEFVSFVNQLPVHKKMDLKLPRGVGEKLLLRVCALKCGLPITAQLAKRAIQFGSRIAKCENRNEKGSDVCKRLKVPAEVIS